MHEANRHFEPQPLTALPVQTCQCIDWFAEGESRVVEVDSLRVIVRFVGRKGRRARIAIEAPAGAVFMSKSQA